MTEWEPRLRRLLCTHAEPNNIKDPNVVAVAGASGEDRNGDDGCKGGSGRVGGDKEGGSESKRDTSGVGSNGGYRSGDGKGREDERYVLRIDGDTEQDDKSKGDTVSEGVSRTEQI